MPQNARLFAEKLNKCLDELDAPHGERERTLVLSKMLHIPKQQAWALLEGQLYPDPLLLEEIATELEVDVDFFNSN